MHTTPRITFSVGPSVTEKFHIIDAWNIPRIMHQDWGSYIHTSWVQTSRRPEGLQTKSWGPESHYRSNQIIIALCSVFHISCDMCTSLPYDRLTTNQGELFNFWVRVVHIAHCWMSHSCDLVGANRTQSFSTVQTRSTQSFLPKRDKEAVMREREFTIIVIDVLTWKRPWYFDWSCLRRLISACCLCNIV